MPACREPSARRSGHDRAVSRGNPTSATRQQLQRIVALDRLQIRGGELQSGEPLDGDFRRPERKVGAEQQMRHRHDVEHGLDRAWRRDADDIDVELAQLVHHAVRHARVQLGAVLGQADEPVGDHGQRAAAMREDPFDVGAAVQRAAEQQADDRAGGVEREFDGRRRDVGNDVEREARRGRVEIDHGLAPVELVEHLREGFVAGILVHVVRRQRDAVGVELIEGIFDLAQAALDVGQRQRREMTEAASVVLLHLGGGLVDLAGEHPRRGGVAEPHARRRNR